MLLKSKAPPPFHSFRKQGEVLIEGPAGINKIFAKSAEERKDGIATLALLVQEGKMNVTEAVDVFGRALCDENRQVRKLAFINLARLGTDGLDGLFFGFRSKDPAIMKMSLDMVSNIVARDASALKSANLDLEGVRAKVGQIVELLRDDKMKVRATECLRNIAPRSPLIVLEAAAARKNEIGRETEEYYRLSLVESYVSQALSGSAADRC
jgi:hypothetical protein